MEVSEKLLKAHIECTQELFAEHVKWSELLFEEHVKRINGWANAGASGDEQPRSDSSSEEANTDEKRTESTDEHIQRSKNWIDNHVRNAGERLQNHIQHAGERFETIGAKE